MTNSKWAVWRKKNILTHVIQACNTIFKRDNQQRVSEEKNEWNSINNWWESNFKLNSINFSRDFCFASDWVANKYFSYAFHGGYRSQWCAQLLLYFDEIIILADMSHMKIWNCFTSKKDFISAYIVLSSVFAFSSSFPRKISTFCASHFQISCIDSRP